MISAMRKKIVPTVATEAETDSSKSNPYLNGRQEWNERYGEYIKQAQSWRLMALISGAVSVAAVLGAVWIGAQSKFIPYIVEVDKLGEAVAVAPAQQAQPEDPRIIESELSNWVYDARTVIADATAE